MATSPDLGEFEALSTPQRRICPLGIAIPTLNKTEAAQLSAALDVTHKVITHKAIADWLGRRKHKVNWAAVRSHRDKTCSCYHDE